MSEAQATRHVRVHVRLDDRTGVRTRARKDVRPYARTLSSLYDMVLDARRSVRTL